MNRALVKLFKSHQVCCFQYVIVNHTTFVNCLILVAHFALLLHILTLVTDRPIQLNNMYIIQGEKY